MANRAIAECAAAAMLASMHGFFMLRFAVQTNRSRGHKSSLRAGCVLTTHAAASN
jgi:hypothetical protein